MRSSVLPEQDPQSCIPLLLSPLGSNARAGCRAERCPKLHHCSRFQSVSRCLLMPVSFDPPTRYLLPDGRCPCSPPWPGQGTGTRLAVPWAPASPQVHAGPRARLGWRRSQPAGADTFSHSTSRGTQVQLISPRELVLDTRTRIPSQDGSRRGVPASVLLVTLLCSAECWRGFRSWDTTAACRRAGIPLPSPCLFLRFPCSAEKAVAEDGPGWLRDRHSLPGSFQLDSSAEGRQGHYCAAGLVLQLKPWMVFLVK